MLIEYFKRKVIKMIKKPDPMINGGQVFLYKRSILSQLNFVILGIS